MFQCCRHVHHRRRTFIPSHRRPDGRGMLSPPRLQADFIWSIAPHVSKSRFMVLWR